MKQNNLSIIIILAIIGGFAAIVFFYQTENTKTREHILYYTKEYLTESSRQYTFYDYDVRVGEKRAFLSLSGEVLKDAVPQMVNDTLYVRQRAASSGTETNAIIVRYNLKGEEVDRLPLPKNDLESFVITNGGQKIAYDWVDKVNANIAEGPWYGGAKWRITIYDYINKEEIVLRAEDLIYEDASMGYLRPLAFDKTSFYFMASPSPSHDIGSPIIIYKVNLENSQTEVVVATGTSIKNTGDAYDAEEYEKEIQEVFLLNQIVPVHQLLFLERGIKEPREVYTLNLKDGITTKFLDEEILRQGVSLTWSSDPFGPISPNGERLILNRGAYNEGFSMIDLASRKLDKDFFLRGNFVSWVSHNSILYEDFRNQRWDDKYYSLRLLDTVTKKERTIYTQTTEHVEGAGLTVPGDTYYIFLGVVRDE